MQRLEEFFELSQVAPLSYETAEPDQKRTLVEKLTSNFEADSENVVVTLRSPFRQLAERQKADFGGVILAFARTFFERNS